MPDTVVKSFRQVPRDTHTWKVILHTDMMKPRDVCRAPNGSVPVWKESQQRMSLDIEAKAKYGRHLFAFDGTPFPIETAELEDFM